MTVKEKVKKAHCLPGKFYRLTLPLDFYEIVFYEPSHIPQSWDWKLVRPGIEGISYIKSIEFMHNAQVGEQVVVIEAWHEIDTNNGYLRVLTENGTLSWLIDTYDGHLVLAGY